MLRREFLAGLSVLTLGCRARSEAPAEQRPARSDLYQCEGCEGALERDASGLSWRVKVGSGLDRGELLQVEGIVYRADGRTPSPGVVIYAYHTNAEGLYAHGSPQTEASRRHGRLRAWVKTDAQGRYRFDTIKPAPYPGGRFPAHIHLTVLEPDRRPYWIDDIVFEGEAGVSEAYRTGMTNRGGNGIIRLQRNGDGVLLARRDIILEAHPAS
jgi:protocatechuate 3,4-dioxygenase beta subunit